MADQKPVILAIDDEPEVLAAVQRAGQRQRADEQTAPDAAWPAAR